MLTLLILLLLLLFLIFYFSWQCLTIRKESVSGYEIGGTNINKKQTSLPSISIKDFLWTIYYGEGKTTEALHRIRKIGSIAEFKFLSSRYVFINDYKLGLEIFKSQVASGRPKYTPHSHYGISGASGANWKDQRKFCSRHLKALGFGSKSIESIIQDEVDVLIESWRRLNSKRFSPNKVFYVPVLNSIWQVCTGERISNDNPELFRLICLSYDCFMEHYKWPNFLALGLSKMKSIRWLAELLPMVKAAKMMSKTLAKVRVIIRNRINNISNSLSVAKAPQNLIEAYLTKIRDTTDENSNFFGIDGDKNLQAVILDLFLAGGDSTASTLAWAMLHLIRNPQMQEKIRAEIDTVVGHSRRPTLQDKVKCLYTEAFIWEVLRFNPFALGSISHITSEDMTVGPHLYSLAKGSVLYLNIFGIHHDPNTFEEPESFKPERFLIVSTDGKISLKHEVLCAFSLGQRRCLGEQVARDSLFLFVSAICQRFVLEKDPLLMEEIPLLGDRKSAVHVPETYFMVAKERI